MVQNVKSTCTCWLHASLTCVSENILDGVGRPECEHIRQAADTFQIDFSRYGVSQFAVLQMCIRSAAVACVNL